MKTKMILLVTLFLLTISTPLLAREGKGEKGQYLKKELNLTDEQFSQLQTLKKAHHEKTKGIRQEIKMLHEKIFTASREGSLNDAEAQSLAQEIGQKHTTLTLEKINHMKEIKEILSDEQFQKLGESMGQREERRKGRAGKWKGKKGRENCPSHTEE